MALTSYSSPNNNYSNVLPCHCKNMWTGYGVRSTCGVIRALGKIQIYPLVNVTDYICMVYELLSQDMHHNPCRSPLYNN